MEILEIRRKNYKYTIFFPFLMRMAHNAIYWKFCACKAQIYIRNTKQVYLRRLIFEKSLI